MVPIKSNYFFNQSLPSDQAEMKSQPFKLIKKTAIVTVLRGYLGVFWFVPPFSTHDLHFYGYRRFSHFLPNPTPTFCLYTSLYITLQSRLELLSL
ncbi:hypothetical protein Hanom_Chr10g00957111 [Helianthus anomalus]